MNATAATSNNETEIWKGSPSQLRHLALFSLCGLIALILLVTAVKVHGTVPAWIPLVLILVPAWIAGQRWLQTACIHISLTDQRLIVVSGIFNRSTDYVELYRIKDVHLTQPFAERMLGLGTIHLRTSQDNAPVIDLAGMVDAQTLWNQIRGLVEARRKTMGVREVDMNTEASG